MPVRTHDRFGAEITLRPDDVAEYARRAGDGNPIHHDPAYAAGTRFGRPIASGAQTTGLLMGLTATHFSRDSAMLGLDFWFRFRRPVFADETVRLEWLAVRRRPPPPPRRARSPARRPPPHTARGAPRAATRSAPSPR